MSADLVVTGGADTQRVDLRVPAELDAPSKLRAAAKEFAEEHGVGDVNGLTLAVSEAATNVVVHAYRDTPRGEVRLVMCAEPDQMVVVVRDWGDGMVPRPDSPGLGLGLPTIASVAKLLNVEVPDGGGTLLRMHFGYAQPMVA